MTHLRLTMRNGKGFRPLLVLRFLACLGIGGMWPSGISLRSEAWSGEVRPVLSGELDWPRGCASGSASVS